MPHDFSTRIDADDTSTNGAASVMRDVLDIEQRASSRSVPATTAAVNDTQGQHGSSQDPVRVLTNDRPYSVFTGRQKALLVCVSTLGACFSGFTANIYFPAIDTISRALGVSISNVNLTVTTYMIFQGIAPSITSAIADEYGRRPAYVIGFIVFMLANLGLGLNKSYAGLMVLRCVQSCGSSGLATLNQGTVADIITSAERGKYIAITSMASILAPSVGPIAGGLLAGNLGWHSIFWFLLIASGVYFIPLALFFPETGRNVVGNGSIKPPAWNRCLTDLIRARQGVEDIEKHHAAEERPKSALPDRSDPASGACQQTTKNRFNAFGTLSIIADPETALILGTIAITYAGFSAISTSLTVEFGRIYGLNSTLQGLLFLPQAAGAAVAAVFNSNVVDRRYKYHASRAGVDADRSKQINVLTTAMPIERARIEIAAPMTAASCTATIVYGWLLYAEINIAGPIVMLFIIGFTALSSFSVLSVLVIDLHRSHSATASAANNLVRCMLGAGATAVVNPVIAAMGLGWCFTLVGLLGIASTSMLVSCAVYGQQMRQRRMEREKKTAEEKERRRCRKEEDTQVERRGWFRWLHFRKTSG